MTKLHVRLWLPVVMQSIQSSLHYPTVPLRALGIGRGDRVALVMPNGPAGVVAFLAVAAGATCAPLNPASPAVEVEMYVSDLRPTALLVQAGTDAAAMTVARARGIPVIEIVPSQQGRAQDTSPWRVRPRGLRCLLRGRSPVMWHCYRRHRGQHLTRKQCP